MKSYNTITLHLDSNSKFSKFKDGNNMADATPYQWIISSLIYLVIGTHSALAFMVLLL